RWAAAALLSDEALGIRPSLPDDPLVALRYNAACCAARLGCGICKDAGVLTDTERTRRRDQARAWLRAALAAWRQRLEKEGDKVRPAVVEQMQHWQADPDFAGVRGPEALTRLPEAERP